MKKVKQIPLPKKKRAKPFPANRKSIEMLTAEGWTCWTVESMIPHTFIKRDCFGFADILAMSPTKGIMLVQATGSVGGGNMADRVAKTREEARHAIWLASGGRIQVHCWTVRAGQKNRECRILEITKQTADAVDEVSASKPKDWAESFLPPSLEDV